MKLRYYKRNTVISVSLIVKPKLHKHSAMKITGRTILKPEAVRVITRAKLSGTIVMRLKLQKAKRIEVC